MRNQPEKITVKLVNRPDNNDLGNSILLRYYMRSPGRIAPGKIVVPIDFISLVLHKIAPPWSILYTLDSLINRLKTFLSLNRELGSQALLPLIDFGNEIERSITGNPVTDLKLNFIKLHNVTDLLGKVESAKLISNYLYPAGWSGIMLKKLFYFSPDDFYDVITEVYSLPFFNEEKFLTYLMKNMRDEWEYNNSAKMDNYKTMSLNHFYLLRNLYLNNGDELPVKLKMILEESFNDYYSKIDTLFNRISTNMDYIKKVDQQDKKEFFANHLSIRKTFYYITNHLNLFNEILTPETVEIIKNLEVDEPEHLDDWLEDFITFRSHIT